MDVSKFSSSAAGELRPIRGHDSYLDRDYDHFAFVPVPLPATVPLRSLTIILMPEDRSWRRSGGAQARTPSRRGWAEAIHS